MQNNDNIFNDDSFNSYKEYLYENNPYPSLYMHDDQEFIKEKRFKENLFRLLGNKSIKDEYNLIIEKRSKLPKIYRDFILKNYKI